MLHPMDWQAVRDAAMRPPIGLPECPPDWTTGPPDFVGIGVGRAGTSRWFNLMRAHPNVAARVKEVHYFRRAWCDPDFDLDRYQLYFPRPPGSISGEWTPRYMGDHWVPSLLAEAAPSAKLLVSLRDPIERYVSTMGLHARQHVKGNPITHTTPGDAVHRGDYHKQLRHVLKHFERAQLLVLQFERCVTERDPELRRTFEFLGLDPDLWPSTFQDKWRNPIEYDYPLSDRERRSLVDRYEDDVAALAAEFPEIDLALWPNFRHLA
jgi:hypothetical protein